MDSIDQENSGVALPNSHRAQPQYPAHDPSLARFLDLLNNPNIQTQRDEAVVVTIATEVDRTPNSPSAQIPRSRDWRIKNWWWIIYTWPAQWFGSLNTLNRYDQRDGYLRESTSNRDEELAENHPATEFETPNDQNQPALASQALEIINHEPSILTRDEQDGTSEYLSESTSIGDEEEVAENHPATQFETPNDQNQPALASQAMENNEPSILTRNGLFSRLPDYSDPGYYLGLYVTLLGIFFLGTSKKHNPLANSFLTISLALFGVAILGCTILCCNQNSSSNRCKILKYVCCILPILAIVFLVLAVIVILQY